MTTTTEKKKTKKEMFNEILEFAIQEGRGDFVDFIKHELDLLDKRGQNKSKKNNEEREQNALSILDKFKNVESFTVGDVVNSTGLSSQKTVSLLRPLIDSGLVTKEKIKGIVHYTVVKQQ